MASRKKPRKAPRKVLKSKKVARTSKPARYASKKLSSRTMVIGTVRTKKGVEQRAAELDGGRASIGYTPSLSLDELKKAVGGRVFLNAMYKLGKKIDPEIDARIEKAAGRKSYASGYHVLDRVRDLSFSGLNAKNALEMARRIKADLPRVRVRFVTAKGI